MFGKVRGAVEALKATARALDPACIDGRDAVALLEAVSEGERVCGAMKALLARRIEETKIWREAGHRSAAHWVAEATGETVGAACRTLETARALDGLRETDAAFREGRLSQTQAAEVTSAAGADPAAETELLEAASSTSVKGLKDRCRHVRAGAEADDRAWARRLHEQRQAHDWNDPEGFYRLEGRLAPDDGAASARPGRPTSTASSVTPAAPGAVSPAPPMPLTHWSRSRAKARASRSRCA